MEITEVRIKLMEGSEDRLRGFCSITFDDCFVVRDLKIIEGNNGPFVAMPSRKLTSHCKTCRTKNHLRARFCNNCGSKLKSGDLAYDSDGRAKLYADIAHPVNAACREMIQNRVIEELDKELELSRMPGYKSRYDDDYEPRSRSRNESRRNDNKPSGNTTTRVDAGHGRADHAAGNRADDNRINEGRTKEGRTEKNRNQEGRAIEGSGDDRRPDGAGGHSGDSSPLLRKDEAEQQKSPHSRSDGDSVSSGKESDRAEDAGDSSADGQQRSPDKGGRGGPSGDDFGKGIFE